MSYPSEQVVKTFIESYLRMKTWTSKGKDGTIKTPDQESEEAHKLDSCKKILQKIDSQLILITKDWINMIDMIYDLEKEEQSRLDNLWFHRRWWGSKDLLHTLQAIRSYILTNVADASDYLDHIKELNKQKTTTGIIYNSRNELNKDPNKPYKPSEIEEAKKAFDAATAKLLPYDLQALKDAGQDHISYFNNTLLVKDPEAAKLNEKTFEDFVKNTNKGVRKTTLCEAAMNPAKPVIEPPTATRGANPPIAAAPTVVAVTTQPKKEKETEKSSLRANSTFQQPQPTTASSTETHRRKTRSTKQYDEDYEPPRSSTSSRYGKY